MSIAKAIIGEPVAKPQTESKTATTPQPIHPMTLIDELAESEFGLAEATSVPHAMKTGKAAQGKKVTGKKTKGQVAAAPGGVKYGKK